MSWFIRWPGTQRISWSSVDKTWCLGVSSKSCWQEKPPTTGSRGNRCNCDQHQALIWFLAASSSSSSLKTPTRLRSATTLQLALSPPHFSSLTSLIAAHTNCLQKTVLKPCRRTPDREQHSSIVSAVKPILPETLQEPSALAQKLADPQRPSRQKRGIDFEDRHLSRRLRGDLQSLSGCDQLQRGKPSQT